MILHHHFTKEVSVHKPVCHSYGDCFCLQINQ